MADIFGVRVAPDLSILDSLIIICNDAGGQSEPAVVFNGQDYIVVWTDAVTGLRASDLKALRIDPSGVVIGPAVTFGTGNYVSDIAFDGARSLVIWSSEHEAVKGRFLNGQALPEDTVFLIDALIGSEASAQLDYDGTQYLVVWSDFDSMGIDREIYGRCISPDGVITSDRILITDDDVHQASPSVRFNGVHYLVAWIEASGAVRGCFIDTTGHVLGDIFQICDTMAYARDNVDIASSYSNHLVVWSEWRSDFDIYGNCEIMVGFRESQPYVMHKTWYTQIIAGPLSSYIYGHWDVFDVQGRKIVLGSVNKGVYFLKNSDGIVHKIVKVR